MVAIILAVTPKYPNAVLPTYALLANDEEE
jgi:hypothetical protein